MSQILGIPANPTLSLCVPELVSQNIEVILNRKSNMEAVLKVIEEHIPEVTYLVIFCSSFSTVTPVSTDV